jgi:hypothetical protein
MILNPILSTFLGSTFWIKADFLKQNSNWENFLEKQAFKSYLKKAN